MDAESEMTASEERNTMITDTAENIQKIAVQLVAALEAMPIGHTRDHKGKPLTRLDTDTWKLGDAEGDAFDIAALIVEQAEARLMAELSDGHHAPVTAVVPGRADALIDWILGDYKDNAEARKAEPPPPVVSHIRAEDGMLVRRVIEDYRQKAEAKKAIRNEVLKKDAEAATILIRPLLPDGQLGEAAPVTVPRNGSELPPGSWIRLADREGRPALEGMVEDGRDHVAWTGSNLVLTMLSDARLGLGAHFCDLNGVTCFIAENTAITREPVLALGTREDEEDELVHDMSLSKHRVHTLLPLLLRFVVSGKLERLQAEDTTELAKVLEEIGREAMGSEAD